MITRNGQWSEQGVGGLQLSLAQRELRKVQDPLVAKFDAVAGGGDGLQRLMEMNDGDLRGGEGLRAGVVGVFKKNRRRFAGLDRQQFA